MDGGFTALWVIWGLMFAGIEGAALFNKKQGDTLSEHVWHYFSTKQKSTGWLIRRSALGVFLAWLVAHFMGWFGL